MNDKYARIERERRFLLPALPPNLDQTTFVQIEDVYITGTRLRLRRMTGPVGDIVALKLGQKFVRPEQPTHHTVMTNFYLTAAEFEILASLPGKKLSKRRYGYDWDGRHFSIDQFSEAHGEIILAEIEALDDETLLSLPLPPFAVREVTADPQYQGGWLAT